MKIDRIAVEKLYPTGLYANVRLRAEASLDDGDDIEWCYKSLQDEVEKVFAAMNPQINWNESIPPNQPPEPTPTITQIDKSLGVTIEDIQSCKEKVVLESYKFLVKGKPELESAYLEKMKEFI